ncbi:unnamed protein product [Cyclocybe aegerita]|uniref:HNH nuclease domain-containing protein n=1 Tax=Cyclocybe aegerita TaxID=1973307 RepID=A0A8S0WE99_CYCAE|nr:unnamed protein product [Cyclocybe aegerita]
MDFTPTAVWPLPSIPNAIFADILADYNTSQPSDTDAFDTGVEERDKSACIVCGVSDPVVLQHCHIIPLADSSTWELMQGLRYIPNNAKSVRHESRNGILMCSNHRAGFESYRFYIRWISESNEFVIVNHSRMAAWESLHGNVLDFNTNMKRCPFPTAFLWHEYRVRGFHPTSDDRPVTFKRGDLRGGRFYRVRDGAGESPEGASSREAENHGGTGERVEADSKGNEDANTSNFFPMRLEGDNLAAWLKQLGNTRRGRTA